MTHAVPPSTRPAASTRSSLPTQLTLGIAADRLRRAQAKERLEARQAQRAFQNATKILAQGFFGEGSRR